MYFTFSIVYVYAVNASEAYSRHWNAWCRKHMLTSCEFVTSRKVTNFQSNLAKGHITDLSPLAVANVFVQYWPPSNNIWFNLGPRVSAPQTASRSVQPFFWHRSPMCPTHRQTRRPRYVRHTCDIRSIRPHLMHGVQAMRPEICRGYDRWQNETWYGLICCICSWYSFESNFSYCARVCIKSVGHYTYRKNSEFDTLFVGFYSLPVRHAFPRNRCYLNVLNVYLAG